MVLIIDNYGFAANITASMVRSLGYAAVVLPCMTDPCRVDVRDYAAVILTAGPGNLSNGSLACCLAGQNSGVPLLGVCQGMELIVRQRGGTVAGTTRFMCEDTLSHTGDGLFRGIGQRFRAVLRQVNAVDRKTLPEVFETDAYSSSGAVQAISIAGEKVYGTGFDPSNYRTEHGLKILYNFLNIS